jgi:four helix bundle protein
MTAKSVTELLVYQKSLAAAAAIGALVETKPLCWDRKTCTQLETASGRIPPLIAEGFSQSTDRHFAEYLFRARGSANEVKAHLAVAHGRRRIASTELSEHTSKYEEIAKMLTGLIKYLQDSDRRNRG